MYKKKARNLKFLGAVYHCLVGNTRGARKLPSFSGSDRLRFNVDVPNSRIPGANRFFKSIYGFCDLLSGQCGPKLNIKREQDGIEAQVHREQPPCAFDRGICLNKLDDVSQRRTPRPFTY